eukprot:g12668.t1
MRTTLFMDERCATHNSKEGCDTQPSCKFTVLGRCVPKTPAEKRKDWECPNQSTWLRKMALKDVERVQAEVTAAELSASADVLNQFLVLFHPELVYDQGRMATKKEFLLCVVAKALSRGMLFAGGGYKQEERPAFPKLLAENVMKEPGAEGVVPAGDVPSTSFLEEGLGEGGGHHIDYDDRRVDFDHITPISFEAQAAATGLIPVDWRAPVWQHHLDRFSDEIRYSSFVKEDVLAIRHSAGVGGHPTRLMQIMDGDWIWRFAILLTIAYLFFAFYIRQTTDHGDVKRTMLTFQGRIIALDESKKQNDEESSAEEEEEIFVLRRADAHPLFEREKEWLSKLVARALRSRLYQAVQGIVLLLWLCMYVFATHQKWRLDSAQRNTLLRTIHDTCLGVTSPQAFQPGETCEVNMFLKNNIDTYVLMYGHTLQILVKFRAFEFYLLGFLTAVWFLRVFAALGDPVFADKNGSLAASVRNYLTRDYFVLLELVLGIFTGFTMILYPDRNWFISLTNYVVFPFTPYAVLSFTWIFLVRAVFDLCEYQVLLHAFAHAFRANRTILYLWVMGIVTVVTVHTAWGIYFQRVERTYDTPGGPLYSPVWSHATSTQQHRANAVDEDLTPTPPGLEQRPAYHDPAPTKADVEYESYSGPVRDSVGHFLRLAGALHLTIAQMQGVQVYYFTHTTISAMFTFYVTCIHVLVFYGIITGVFGSALHFMHDTLNELRGEKDTDLSDVFGRVPLRKAAVVTPLMKRALLPVLEDDEVRVRDEETLMSRLLQRKNEPEETALSRALLYDRPVSNTLYQAASFVPVMLLTCCFEYDERENYVGFNGRDRCVFVFRLTLLLDVGVTLWAAAETAVTWSRCQVFAQMDNYAEPLDADAAESDSLGGGAGDDATLARLHEDARKSSEERAREEQKKVTRAGFSRYPFTFLGFLDVYSVIGPTIAYVMCATRLAGVEEILYPNGRKMYLLDYPQRPPFVQADDDLWRCGYHCLLTTIVDSEEWAQFGFISFLVSGRLANIVKPVRYYDTLNMVAIGIHNNRHVFRFVLLLTFVFILGGGIFLYSTSYDPLLPNDAPEINSLPMAFWKMFQKLCKGAEAGYNHQVWGVHVLFTALGVCIGCLNFAIFSAAFDITAEEGDYAADEEDAREHHESYRGVHNTGPTDAELAALDNQAWLKIHEETPDLVRLANRVHFEDRYGLGKCYYFTVLSTLLLAFWTTHAYSASWYQISVLESHLDSTGDTTSIYPAEEALRAIGRSSSSSSFMETAEEDVANPADVSIATLAMRRKTTPTSSSRIMMKNQQRRCSHLLLKLQLLQFHKLRYRHHFLIRQRNHLLRQRNHLLCQRQHLLRQRQRKLYLEASKENSGGMNTPPTAAPAYPPPTSYAAGSFTQKAAVGGPPAWAAMPGSTSGAAATGAYGTPPPPGPGWAAGATPAPASGASQHITSDLGKVESEYGGYRNPALEVDPEYVLVWDVQPGEQPREDGRKAVELSPHFGSFCNTWDMPAASAWGTSVFDNCVPPKDKDHPSCHESFCYVDPCRCDKADLMVTGQFAWDGSKHKDEAKSLAHSYATCSRCASRSVEACPFYTKCIKSS